MIILIHRNNSVLKILNEDSLEINFPSEKSIGDTIFSLAKEYRAQLIIWCNEVFFDALNHIELRNIFHHKRIMASWSVAKKGYIPSQIGYVEDSPFIKVNHDVSYPTWKMSSDVGGIYAEVLNAVEPKGFRLKNFDYFLVSFAKTLMPEGLLCYSDGRLLKQQISEKKTSKEATSYEFFRFIKEHYKSKWVLMVFLCELIYEKKVALLPLLSSLFYVQKKKINYGISEIQIRSDQSPNLQNEIDVIIPTIGRKKFLLDVLVDLSEQSMLPQRIIIVEQDPDPNGKSNLEYLTEKEWPFKIVHHFIHQTGACNARNLAISETRAAWIFLADDDNRLQPDTLKQALSILTDLGAKAITSSYLQRDEKKTDTVIRQWSTFGAGNSFILGDVARSVKFDLGYEHGYGEDKDYGMKLRNIGVDVIYHPFDILHLKAPVGGFRKPIINPWEQDEIASKPSPTIMLFRLNHTTNEQQNGYKLLFFLKFYRKQQIKNPFTYLKAMRKSWDRSVYWAQKLKEA